MFKCFRGNAASVKPAFFYWWWWCCWWWWGGGGGSEPFLSQIWHKFAEISTRVSHKTKTVSKQYFKIKYLSGNDTYPKVKVLVHFWVQFTPGKPKILPKTRIFPETRPLLPSNNTSTRPQINHRILIKLTKKSILGGKNWTFYEKNENKQKSRCQRSV